MVLVNLVSDRKGSLMSDSSSLRPRERRDRKATEKLIVNAFETVLLREGVQGLGINAIAQEAGINKVLIYRYYNDLPGLARHWSSNSSFWPSELELIGNDPDAFAKLAISDRVKAVLCNYIDAIRARPATIEMLAAELLNPTDITRALSEGMARPGIGVAEYIELEKSEKDLTDKVWKLILMVSAMTAYMTIRERANPLYLGFDMTEDESWILLRDTVSDIADKYLKD
jgi:AcrR family transcriptional regulator